MSSFITIYHFHYTRTHIKGLVQLSVDALVQLIDRNSFCAPEIDIFNMVRRWVDAHPNEVNIGKSQTILINSDALFITAIFGYLSNTGSVTMGIHLTWDITRLTNLPNYDRDSCTVISV